MTMGKAERIGNWERPELREEKLIYGKIKKPIFIDS